MGEVDDRESFQGSEMDVSSSDNDSGPRTKARRTTKRSSCVPRILRIPSELTDHSRKGALRLLKPATRRQQTGSVFVCGTGDCGQLGLGDDLIETETPRLLRSLESEEIVDVACGGMHAIALTRGGKVLSWGNNDQCTLGRGGDEMVPAPVSKLANVKINRISCTDSATILLDEHGTMYLCGCFRTVDGLLGATKEKQVLQEPQILDQTKDITFVDSDAGSDHFVLLDDRGRVWCFGDGIQFQLGRRVMLRRRTNSLIPNYLSLKKIVSVGAGAYHSFAIDEDGRAYAWGLNNYAQCGLGSCDPHIVESPTLIEALSGLRTTKIKGGEHFSMALTESGQLYAWGRSEFGQLGVDISSLGSNTAVGSNKVVVLRPTLVSSLAHSKIVQFDTGSAHCIALSDDGKVFSWGFGVTGCLCLSDTNDRVIPELVDAKHFKSRKPIKVCTGAQHSVILANGDSQN